MVDLTATQLYAKGAAPLGSREGGGGGRGRYGQAPERATSTLRR
jgi:hypothetical protein